MERMIPYINEIKSIQVYDLNGLIKFKTAINNISSILNTKLYKTFKENDTYMDTMFDFHNFATSCYGPFNKYRNIYRSFINLNNTLKIININVDENYILNILNQQNENLTLNTDKFVKQNNYSYCFDDFLKEITDFIEVINLYTNIDKMQMFKDYLRTNDNIHTMKDDVIKIYTFKDNTCEIITCYLDYWTFSYSERTEKVNDMYKNHEYKDLISEYYPELAL